MVTQISVDLMLIGRCFTALCWGILLAVFLQFSRMGRFLAAERTWLSVVAGVGIDLLIGIGATWWQMWLIVVFSSLGIIARSLLNEHSETEPALNRYKTKWQMEDTIDRCGDVIGALEKALAATDDGARVQHISQALTAAHQASREITAARYGMPEKK
ncbi:MAG: hypothetical protein JXA21_16760 [Anaerolineae bacterium]|nr:hypothetical protein [Anaerolineae bacterium]